MSIYTRPFAEALVLMAGEAAVDVENRRYRPGLAGCDSHSCGTLAPGGQPIGNHPAVFHVAISSPTADTDMGQHPIHAGSISLPVSRGTRGRNGSATTARPDRFELAPRALFQDLYNIDLGTKGICGGYGVFEPGARLPCHRHEFDESITITGYGNLRRRGAAVTSSRTMRLRWCPRDAATISSI